MSRAFLRVFALALLMLIGHVHAAYEMAEPCSEHEHSQEKHANHCDACSTCAAASIAQADRPLIFPAAARGKYFDPDSPPLSAAPHELYRPPIAL